MVRAWFFDSNSENPHLPNFPNDSSFLSTEILKDRCGILYYKVDPKNFKNDETLQRLRRERGYTYEDQIRLDNNTPELEKKLTIFYEEHLHTDEEIRLFIDGSGYFDVRDRDEKWIRIEMDAGDMIILPAGIYHRFTLDTNMFVVANRYFIGEPVWKAYPRPADEMPCRKQYLQEMGMVA